MKLNVISTSRCLRGMVDRRCPAVSSACNKLQSVSQWSSWSTYRLNVHQSPCVLESQRVAAARRALCLTVMPRRRCCRLGCPLYTLLLSHAPTHTHTLADIHHCRYRASLTPLSLVLLKKYRYSTLAFCIRQNCVRGLPNKFTAKTLML